MKQRIYKEVFCRYRKVTLKKLKRYLKCQGIAGEDVEITGIDGNFKECQVDGVIFIATMFTRKHKQMLKDIRILGDTTAAEVYLNKGEVVFSTRYYPQDRKQALKINAQQIKGNLYQLDSMKFTK